MTWRDRARPIIAAVILETQGQDEKAVNQALRDAYPFGPMSHHPYKIWRDEIRLQLGFTETKATGRIQSKTRTARSTSGKFDLNYMGTQLTIDDIVILPGFDGPAYQSRFDHARLTGQIQRVFSLMADGRWRTLQEIADTTKDPHASISAQLRHLRKERFGGHTVNRRARGDRERGLFEYQLQVRDV